MASVFKTFLNNDITSTRTLLHEAIPITGTLLSGTYTSTPSSKGTVFGSDENIKKYSHGQFVSLYDYPYLSSSSNHIFDITTGFSAQSFYSASANCTVQRTKKLNMYTQLAQMLMGHDKDGNVNRFDRDGNLVGGTKIDEAVFFNFSRLLVKDEIKKGSFNMTFGVEVTGTNCHRNRVKIADTNAASSFFVNSPVGEYGILTASAPTVAEQDAHHGNTGILAGGANHKVDVGLIFYQAGIAVVTASLFQTASVHYASTNGRGTGLGGLTSTDPGLLSSTASAGASPAAGSGLYINMTGTNRPTDGVNGLGGGGTAGLNTDMNAALNRYTISEIADGIRQRVTNISFNNTTELNSTVYFCRAGHNEFNYSSNPTYLKNSRLRVKNESTDAPRSYITTVGLYSADNELLAVAKLSEPLRKDPTNELTLRVRLDY